jgi:DNA-binding YbaB/EbfC family protein
MRNQAQMMQQLRKMQEAMTKAQEELANTTVTGSASGEVIKVEITGDMHVKSVKVAAEAVDPEDIETLEDLLVVAFNDALTKAQDLSSKKLGAVTGGIKIPGM